MKPRIDIEEDNLETIHNSLEVHEGALYIQVNKSHDGRVWINLNGICLVRGWGLERITVTKESQL